MIEYFLWGASLAWIIILSKNAMEVIISRVDIYLEFKSKRLWIEEQRLELEKKQFQHHLECCGTDSDPELDLDPERN